MDAINSWILLRQREAVVESQQSVTITGESGGAGDPALGASFEAFGITSWVTFCGLVSISFY